MTESIKSGKTLAELENAKPRTVALIDRVFVEARLPVRIVFHGGTIKATRAGVVFSINEMSDGERAALLLVGSILIQDKEAIIAIDEPEKHLNPSISGPLIFSAMGVRPDLGYLLSTHDLSVVDWVTPATIIHVRDSVVAVTQPVETRRFDFQVLREDDLVADELRQSILGARRAALIVEGELDSFDKLLYSLLYPHRLVVPRGGSDNVISAVRALRASSQYHWLDAIGIIDADGRNDEEKSKLTADNIYTTGVPTIENLFIEPEVFSCMCQAIFDLQGGRSPSKRIEDAAHAAHLALIESSTRIANLATVWAVNRAISEMKISLKDLDSGLEDHKSFSLKDIQIKTARLISDTIEKNGGILAAHKLPIKKTKVPAKIVEAAGFDNFDVYRKAVLHQIQAGGFIERRYWTASV